MGPKEPRSTVLSAEDEAVVVAFRRHTLLSIDDRLYALGPTIPHLTRSSLHRGLQRHGISRRPDVDGDQPKRSRFKAYPIGYFHVDIAQSSPSLNCTRGPHNGWRLHFCTTLPRLSLTRSTRF